jgi:hypothetical protein
VQKAAKLGRPAEPGGCERTYSESIRNTQRKEITGVEDPKFHQILEFLPTAALAIF